MNNKRLIVTCLLSIILVCILFIGNTLSVETVREVDENLNYYSTGNLNISYSTSDSEVVLNNGYPMTKEEAMLLDPYRITVYNNGNVNYKFNLILDDVTETDVIDYKYINVQVGRKESVTLDSVENNIIADEIIVGAGESVDLDIFVWLSDMIENSQIGKGFYAKVSIDGLAVMADNTTDNWDLIYNLDTSGANVPELDGVLVPVYYDDKLDIWCRADVNNGYSEYQWYDYGNKMWANAVLVKEKGINDRAYYLSNEALGKEIKAEDIVAFFTWIPRYKYRVWNINGNSDISINNIEIMFEKGKATTGNIYCKLDSCYYVDQLIKSDEVYSDAWYTHPAFSYGEEDVTGIWVGKFETTGSSDSPSILPDSVSLREQSISEQFSTSRLFNKYGLSDLDSHMMRNSEWGAVSYLASSIYGLCENKENIVVCNKSYNNNSAGYYTGSGGLSDSAVSKFGSYNYQGYLLNSTSLNRVVDKSKKESIIASSTLNLYGVYDLAGGSIERVMGGTIDNLDVDYNYFELYDIDRVLGDGIFEFGGIDIGLEKYVFIRGSLFDSVSNFFEFRYGNEASGENVGFRIVLS